MNNQSARKTRILIIASLADSLVNFRGALIQTLGRSGYSVHAAAPQPSDSVFEALASMGAKLHSFPLDRSGTSIVRDIGTVASLVRLMRGVKPDIVLAYTAKPVLYGALALTPYPRIRFIALMTGLGYTFSDAAGSRKIMSKIVMLLYRRAVIRSSAVIFQNPDDEREFAQRGLIVPGEARYVVNGSGVDLDHFKTMPLPNEVRFLMISRLIRSKGVIEYLEAAGQVLRRFPGVQCALIGWEESGPDAIDAESVRRLASKHGVELLGRTDDVRSELARSSVYVLPSYREGLPRTVLEGMATGRPIITTDVAGCREAVQHGRNGFLVPPRDANILAKTMMRFVSEPELGEKMGRESRLLAEQRFNVVDVNRSMIEILEQA